MNLSERLINSSNDFGVTFRSELEKLFKNPIQINSRNLELLHTLGLKYSSKFLYYSLSRLTLNNSEHFTDAKLLFYRIKNVLSKMLRFSRLFLVKIYTSFPIDTLKKTEMCVWNRSKLAKTLERKYHVLRNERDLRLSDGVEQSGWGNVNFVTTAYFRKMLQL